MATATAPLSPSERHICTDSISFQPQVVQSSVRGLISPPPTSTTAKPLTLDQLHQIIGQYGPILHLHPDEPYLNTSIEDFLHYCTLVDKKAKTRVKDPSPDSLPQKGDDDQYYLELDPKGQGGNFATAKAYVRALWRQGMSSTDLQFWFFNAYNGPGTLHINGLVMDSITHTGDVNVKPLGAHVGDWEMCMLRVDNTTTKVIAIWLSQHAKGQFFTGDQIDHAFTFQGLQPNIYSALNGHGNFPRAGSNPSEYRKIGGIPAGVDFFVRNDTSGAGKVLDCSKNYEIVAAEWLSFPSPKWVTYPFRWGPEGTHTRLTPFAVANVVKSVVGTELIEFLPVAVLTLIAGELLPVFVKGDINGPASPSKHGSWMGATYPVY